MLRSAVLLANLIALPASLLACQTGTFQEQKTGFECSPNATAETDLVSLVLELDRAILVLKQGLKENWDTRDQYLVAYEKTPTTDPSGQPVSDAKEYVACAIGAHLPTHEIWNEGFPLGVQADRTITEFTRLRNEAEQARTAVAGYSKTGGKVAEFRLPPCSLAPPRKVAVSAGVASGMLETKVDPVDPSGGHIVGTVVLRVTISTRGRVEGICIMSGPALLQQAALDAVRQWTYRPYLLNKIAVEVVTTINVAFTPQH